MKSGFDYKVAFIHGRPAPHPSHAALARSVNSEFHFVDAKIPYHEQADSSRIRRYTSWIANAATFPNRRQYDALMTEGIHFPPVLMRRLGLLSKKQKLFAMLGNEMLYFLKIGRYAPHSHRAMIDAMTRCDALFCMGEMGVELATELLKAKNSRVQIYRTLEVTSDKRHNAYMHLSPDLNGTNLLFLAHGTDGWRGFYKGIDLLLETFELVAAKFDNARLRIIGEWNPEYVKPMLDKMKIGRDRVHFLGKLSDLEKPLEETALYIHLARGEAFGIAVTEAMSAGLPCVVSEWTGAREAVQKAASDLVVPLDAEKAAEKVAWYLNLPLAEKQRLSVACRQSAALYTEENSLGLFRRAFAQAMSN